MSAVDATPRKIFTAVATNVAEEEAIRGRAQQQQQKSPQVQQQEQQQSPGWLAQLATPVLHAAKDTAAILLETLGAPSASGTVNGVRSNGKKASTRAGFLRTLSEVIGMPPPPDSDGHLPWRQEYELLNLVWDTEASTGCSEGEAHKALGFDTLADLVTYLGTREGGDWLHTKGLTLEQNLGREANHIDELVRRGWEQEHATAFTLLYQLRSVLARDLQGARDLQNVDEVLFPASNFAVCEALYATGQQVELIRRTDSSQSLFRAAMAVETRRGDRFRMRRLYKHLTGPNSLSAADPAWAGLVEPDRTGFRGLTSSALVVASSNRNCFVEDGFRNATDEGFELIDSDVVCFESGADGEEDDQMMHEPVLIDDQNGALPPNTLFRLKRVMEAGEWEVDGVVDGAHHEEQVSGDNGAEVIADQDVASRKLGGGHRENGVRRMAKGKSSALIYSNRPTPREAAGLAVEAAPRETMVHAKVRPRVRLLVVSCTFKKPLEGSRDAWRGSKLCGSVHTLRYADRSTYVHGLDDILVDPVLTMAEEMGRPIQWRDWRGVSHDLRDLWAYVNGPALPLDLSSSGAGWRDLGNDGKSPEDFRQEVNADIRRRRAEILAAGKADCESGSDPRWMLLEAGDASELTLDEVLAVRMYSGPAFQPINDFLREIGHLSGKYRNLMARHPELTFAATAAHLCSAIRKLADVTRDSSLSGHTSVPLYRAVRGELPPAFWDTDPQGMISAVDNGFMSTSRNEETPIRYMDGEFNVLWQLRSSEPRDDAFHRGADISLLSQFRHEDEILFPPCTMMIVERNAAAQVRATFQSSLAVAVAADAPQRLVERMKNMSSLASDEKSDDGSGKAWKRIHVRPCFV